MTTELWTELDDIRAAVEIASSLLDKLLEEDE